MIAALKRFLWLWLPMLALLLAGLWLAWRTGQADPWDWGGSALVVAMSVGLFSARRGSPMLIWAAMGMAGPVLLFCTLAAGRMPDGLAAMALPAIALLAILGAAWLRFPSSDIHWAGRSAGAVMLLFAGLLVWLGPAGGIASAPDRPKLAILTALPLFWAEPGQAGTGPRDAPIVTLLRTRFTVEPLDDPVQLIGSDVRRLLVAQPRSLSPRQRVALDQWVRGGGTALILADPLLRWPSVLPLGDRRRAPSVSLLTPIVDHWGFGHGALEPAEIRHFLPDGRLLTLSGAAMGDPLPQHRRIGRGSVLLVGDADLLDDRLWLADPSRPRDPRRWVADTPALIAQWLGAPIPGERRWMRAPADVILGLRWAILVGTGWAMLGSVLLAAQFAAKTTGTKSEYEAERSRENSPTHF